MRRDKSHATRAIVASVFAAALSVVFSGAGCGVENAIVGGECRDGFTECSQACVDLANDRSNCGGCGVVCAPGVFCGFGICGGGNGDGSSDGNAFADGSGDGSGDGAANGDGSSSDDGSSGNSDGSADDGSSSDGGNLSDACVPPYNTPAQCGTCTNACVAPKTECVPIGMGGFACAPLCIAPLELCGVECVDKQNDPFHCGACFKQCASGICVAGVCQGATPGDVVVIGHDFSGTTFSAGGQTRLLTNAVFIPQTNPLRVLSYEQFSSGTAVAAVKANLATAGAGLGRTVNFTVSTDFNDLASANLPNQFDVVLIYDQATASNAQAITIGTTAAAALTAFTTGGGVVVALDGNSGNGEMPALLSNAQLLQVTSHQTRATPGTNVSVTAGGDSVGAGVISLYAAGIRTASFVTSEVAVTVVARTVAAPQDPVVVHKSVP